jgi:superfamily I DNA and/or RNA helicase
MMTKFKCQPSEIRVITPYTAQREHIEDLFLSNNLKDVEVLSVFASQGGEADFIILSTVRSLPKRELVEKPSRKWKKNQLGFIADEHQMNVALTRARHGLVIVGNSNLLSLHSMWKTLLDHYRDHDCFIEDWSKLSF